MKVRKAVIPAAGWGTRFLPATRAFPKELLSLVNKPVIQYAVEEALASGIGQIIVVISPFTNAIRDYFRPHPELAALLRSRGNGELADEMERLDRMADIIYVVQPERRGLGHAVLMAKEVVGMEPFAVILPDDVIDAREPALAQMLRVFDSRQAGVVAVENIDRSEIGRYGVVRTETVAPRLHRVLSLVEKPEPAKAPSRLGIVGRYILTPQIFEVVESIPPGSGGEIQLTDALSVLLKRQGLYALEFDGRRFDTGSPPGWIEAQAAFGMKNQDYGEALREKLRQLTSYE
ncbi:MAG: UTP--glucose-1-phosphate uridylyltransferase [Dehalococcoidia bacterium]|nr:UTP--glucose-1-phosphate uridylyltransferase [Dehalococcoidia bacterium]